MCLKLVYRAKLRKRDFGRWREEEEEGEGAEGKGLLLKEIQKWEKRQPIMDGPDHATTHAFPPNASIHSH